MAFLRINILVLFLTFLTSASSFASLISSNELGFPNSSFLQEEIKKAFYNSGQIDQQKLLVFKNDILKSKEYFIQNRISFRIEGVSLTNAETKARKHKRVKVYDIILGRINALNSLSLNYEKESSLQEIYSLYYATKNQSDSGSIKEVIKTAMAISFQKYHLPVKDLKRPIPSNLLNKDEKSYYSKEELKEMINNGDDLSLIDPPNNPFWKKPHKISQINPISSYEREGRVPTELIFKRLKVSGTHPKFHAVEKLPDGSKLQWKVKISRETQPEYVGAQLMKLVGYNYDESYVVENLKIYFKNKKQFDKFIKEWLDSYYDFYTMPFNYIKDKGQDEKGYFVVFFEALLEPRPKDVLRAGKLHLEKMGYFERREIRAQLLMQALIGNSDYRTSRNNLIKLVKNANAPGGYEMQELVQDLGYSFGLLWPNEPNEFGWSFIKKKGKKIKINYATIVFFKSGKNPLLNASYSDLKWIARYFAQITRDQLKTILIHSKWPAPIQKLILEKLITRRNEVVETFDLEGEYVDGKQINLWPEVNPKKFSYGEFIKDGALVDDYKPKNKPYSYSNLFKIPSDILIMGLPLLEMLGGMTKEIPFHEMIKHPFEVSGFETTRFFVGAGVGFRFKREVTPNREAQEGSKTWITKDTLQIFGTIGGEFSVPITEQVTGYVEGKTLLGKQYEISYHSANIWEAMKGDIKKVASLPFKKKNIINQLKIGESYGSGIFFGLEFAEGVEWGPHAVFASGFEFRQKIKWLTRTEVLKTGPGKFEVTKAKSKEFTFGFAAFIRLVYILKIDIFSASLMAGDSDGNTFYFDLAGDKSFEMQEAFHKLVYGRDLKLAKELVPYSKIQMQYYENKWRFGFMVSHVGSQTNGMYKFITMPDGTMKRSFEYKTVLDFNKLSNESDQFFEVNGRLEFGDEDWMQVTKQNIGIKYRVSDVETTFVEMDNYINKINLLADQKDFVTNDFYGDFLNHLGITYIQMDMEFQPDAISCLFHRRKCEAKGPKAYKFDQKLKKISKIKRPIRKLERLGKFLRKQIYKPERFKNVLDFIGRDNISTELIITGYYLKGKDAIRRKKGPKIPLAI